MVWDEDTIRLLTEFWSQGLSTAEIGRRLGVSKNAIVGKAHRLELDARPSPIRRTLVNPAMDFSVPCGKMVGATLPPLASAQPQSVASEQTQARVAPAVSTPVAPEDSTNVQSLRPAPVADPQPAAVIPAAPPAPRPVMPSLPIQAPALRTMPVRRAVPSCCWPIGEPGTKTFRFCDDTSVAGKPYCDEHAKLAYVRIRDRKEDAA
jgi:GcrA cell cycle regulator